MNASQSTIRKGEVSTRKRSEVQKKLNQKILVLTRTYIPVTITTVKPAMILLCTGRGKVVDEDYAEYTLDEWIELKEMEAEESGQTINTIDLTIQIPDIIVLPDIDHPPRYDVKFSFANVISRDNYTCQYCKKKLPKKDLTIDHVIPKSKGGKSTWENCVAACFACNTSKADKDLSRCRMQLARMPKKPASIFRINRDKITNKRWQQFIR